jgi:Ca2+-binding RTX toxin-like protein
VTVTFDDGSSRSGQTFRVPNSPHSSQATLKAGSPPKPSVEALGVTAPSEVTDPSQTVRVSAPAGSSVSVMVLEAGLFTEGVPGGGFDLDPFESNNAIAVEEKGAQVGSEGYVDVPVTLTRTDSAYGGFNNIVAVVKDASGRTGPLSDPLVLELRDQNSCTISGTSLGETLTGTEGRDIICGLGGADTLRGLGGNDKLIGGDGGDKLVGGAGDDAFDGGGDIGRDTADYSGSAARVEASLLSNTATGEGSDSLMSIENLTGSQSNDELIGSDLANRLSGKGGRDTLRGLGGPDSLNGNGWADTLLGGAGDDSVTGAEGPDLHYGEAGNDSLDSKDGSNGNDTLDGGDGTDACTTDATEKSITSCET